MATRDFDVAVDEVLANRPTFHLGGREWTCKPTLSTQTMLAFYAQTDTVEAENALDTLKGFFDKALIKADRAPFVEMLDKGDDEDDAVVIPMTVLSEIVKWLVEQYTGKALEPSNESSSTLPDPSGLPVKLVSLDPGSAPRYSSAG